MRFKARLYLQIVPHCQQKNKKQKPDNVKQRKVKIVSKISSTTTKFRQREIVEPNVLIRRIILTLPVTVCTYPACVQNTQGLLRVDFKQQFKEVKCYCGTVDFTKSFFQVLQWSQCPLTSTTPFKPDPLALSSWRGCPSPHRRGESHHRP